MKTAKSIAAVAFAFSLLATSAGAWQKTSLSYANYAGEPIERFTAFDIDGWTPVDRNRVVLWTGVNEAFLVKVWDNCRDLQFADAIAVTRTASSVSRFESLRVGADRCPISEIRRVDVKQMRADRRAARAQDLK